MKKYLLVALSLFAASALQAQSLKQVSNFSQNQLYYNPSLTGYGGSAIKSFYRNQWTGFEGAPNTILLSAEFDLADLASEKTRSKQPVTHYQYAGAKHALGAVILQDKFGPSRETQFALNYSADVRLSEHLGLRWGTALTYSGHRLDGSSLVVDDMANDPRYQRALANNSSFSKLDLDLGIALTSENFYLGYALQDITKGKFVTMGDDYMNYLFTHKHMVQAGYRASVSNQIGLVANALYQHDEVLVGTLDTQLKAVYMNRFWLGTGYRVNQAFHVTGGVRFDQFSLSYAFETPVQDASMFNASTNEISIGYMLNSRLNKHIKQAVTVW
ncbi:type IX secretion system membrane protein PorP/SprF [Pontibacter sp. SGAir0037]|uniref:PorP/SprF family type IX secretion system membrane protein n=1 Tax=Pontibacter sp. SGAir0037 TaxID=2571030 RepID=UPI0010CCCBA4|nr:type IX secretion system membrane protein PorP/SprF [Pontibacter sp. SGAir0037]QCR21527.1 hypothetical protein C1N53_03635 [Pontibacter sp. SGAir0037]